MVNEIAPPESAKKALVKVAQILNDIVDLPNEKYGDVMQDLFIDHKGILAGESGEVCSEQDVDYIAIPIGLLESVLKCAGVVERQSIVNELERSISQSFEDKSQWHISKQNIKEIADILQQISDL